MTSEVTKSGDRVDIEYNAAADRYVHFSINVRSGLFVGVLRSKPTIIESNAVGIKVNQFPYFAVTAIDGATLQGSTEEELTVDCYNKLKNLL